MLTFVRIPAGIFIAFDCSNDLTPTPQHVAAEMESFSILSNSYSWEKISSSSPSAGFALITAGGRLLLSMLEGAFMGADVEDRETVPITKPIRSEDSARFNPEH